jgi:hypothetical protein
MTSDQEWGNHVVHGFVLNSGYDYWNERAKEAADGYTKEEALERLAEAMEEVFWDECNTLPADGWTRDFVASALKYVDWEEAALAFEETIENWCDEEDDDA